MKKVIMVLLLFFFYFYFIFFFAGCATEFSATGGPAVLANLASNLRNQGSLKTSPGGFTERNRDARIGAITNEEQAVSKDVEIFVQGEGYLWRPYDGPAEVYVPSGWIKEWDGKKWLWKKLSSRWFKVDGLEAIHFESAFTQSVTLRTSAGEILFETAGRKETGNSSERINVLFIKLPERQYGYRLNVYTYEGQLFFKSVRGIPYTRHLSFDGDPTDYKFGNMWVGWKLVL